MKTPPLLLGAALLFWGWQSGFLVAGAVMGVVLESARLIKARWEFSDEDFNHVWMLCSVLFLSAAVYAFTANEGPSRFSHVFQNPALANQSGARTATALFRWLPMIFFLFVAAQAYSAREEIPWSTISRISRWRWKQAGKNGQPSPPGRGVNAAFPYFALCLFAASTHPSENSLYFWGLALLLAWALWPQRSRRFGLVTWVGTLALAMLLGYVGQQNFGRLQNYIMNLEPDLFSRFVRRRSDPACSTTSIGSIGRLKQSGRIVIRLKPEIGNPPTYLREASYRSFRSPFWYESMPQLDFESLQSETNGTTWMLLPDKTNTAKVQIACYLQSVSPETRNPAGLLPLPEGCGGLENLPVFLLRKNSVGAVLAEGPGLVIFEASFGPGATIDAPPDVNPATPYYRSLRLDGSVSRAEEPALDRVISGLQLEGKSNDQKLQIINGFFQTQFTYSTWQEKPPPASTDETPLSRFLLHTRRGHCEYFATATVLLLRRLQIPARYAVGYVVHEPASHGYVVRQRDAHAWCLVWDDRTHTWQDFDTTPASWAGEESKRASPWQRLSDFWSWMRFEFSKLRWGQTHLRRYLLLLLAPMLGFLLYRIIFRRKRKREHHKNAAAGAPVPWPGRDSEFYLIERKLEDRGVLRRPDEPLSAWLRRAALDPAVAEVGRPLQALLRLHYRYRFDPHSLNSADREALRRGTERVLETIVRKN
jgi:hypothetical protein